MAHTASFSGPNSGLQVGSNSGHITAQYHVSGENTTSDQACLRDLQTTNPRDDKSRIEATKGGLLQDVYRWIFENHDFKRWCNNSNPRLLWIKGDPGKGKTMLLCGIIDELISSAPGTPIVSFFFCQATDAQINNATSVLRGLIFMLVDQQPSLISHVRRRYDITGRTTFEDRNAWQALSNILISILQDPLLRHTYLIIDALDECTTDLGLLLNLIAQESAAHPHVKWIVSSRNWLDIEEALDASQNSKLWLELNENAINEAVTIFIYHKVQELTKLKKYKDEVRDAVTYHLLSNAHGTFLWVALVCQALAKGARWKTRSLLTVFPPGLEPLYDRMIERIRDSEDAEICKRILGVILAVYRPITLAELSALINMPDDFSDEHDFLVEIIGTCGSFLTLRESVISFVHQSAKDFLLQKSSNEIFARGIEAEHHAIFSQSLKLFKLLQRDIYQLKSPGFSIDRVKKPDPDPLVAAEYSCLHWVDHLRDCHASDDAYDDLQEDGSVEQFLKKRFLYWLEAVSLLKGISEGIAAIMKLNSILQDMSKSQALLKRVQDASRFIRYHRRAIERSPLQVYYSALVFSPLQSMTAMCYQEEDPHWVLKKPMLEGQWSPCLHTLEEHRGRVNTIAWSPDGVWIASGSRDQKVKIWNASTGQCTSTLNGHSSEVTSIAWSPDGSQLASGSEDRTVRIWNPSNGECISTLDGHNDSICAITWSPDATLIASGSNNQIVRIWDPKTGECKSTLDRQNGSVYLAAWSLDGMWIASVSSDQRVKVWNPRTAQCTSTLDGHSSIVTSIAWSPDGNQIASGSIDKTIRIWDTTNWRCTSILEGHNELVALVIWSPDGSRLASGSNDKTVRIWDATSGQCILTLSGHSESIWSIAWSQFGSRLASSSADLTIKIWDTATGKCTMTFKGHRNTVRLIVWSPDGSWLASASYDKTVKIWEPAGEQYVATEEGHNGSVTVIAWSPGGRWLASGSRDKAVKVWDSATARCISTFEGHGDLITSIAWSQDGGRLASASFDQTIRIWGLISEQFMPTLEGHSGIVRIVTWSPDGSLLASGSEDRTIKIWDTANGLCISTLSGQSLVTRSISWSLDGSRFASDSNDETIKIWNPATGKCTLTLEGHTRSVESVVWSPDGSQLASTSYDNTVRVWNSSDGQCTLTLTGHSHAATSLAWSHDGSLLISGSHNKTLRIWDPPSRQCTANFSIGSSDGLQFDESNEHQLKTGIGIFYLTPLGFGAKLSDKPAPLPQQVGYGLNEDRSWITFEGENRLWLPSEYRPVEDSLFTTYATTSTTTVAIGCSTGRVLIFGLLQNTSIL